MSKGAGAIGSGSVRGIVVRGIGQIGGLHNAIDHSGMRAESLAHWRSRFAGLSPSDVQALARSMAPIRVAVYGNKVTVEDGRHRLTAAREAGAAKVAVEARVVGLHGASSATWRGTVRS